MEILKKISLVVLLVFAFNTIFAQQEDKVAKAFSDSYVHEKEKNYTAAAESMKKVYDASSYAINMRLGWLTYMAAQYNTSLTYYQICIRLMPLSIEARMGYVYPASALGNWDLVLAKYAEILKIDPNHYYANLYSGQIYTKQKQYKKADKYYTVLLNHFPFTYEIVIAAAWNDYYLGKYREAKVLFQKALWLYPNDKSASEGLKLVN